jgi:hypothetical protein
MAMAVLFCLTTIILAVFTGIGWLVRTLNRTGSISASV